MAAASAKERVVKFFAIFLFGSAAICLSQTPGALRLGRVEAAVEKVTVDQDAPEDLFISVRVTIYAGDQAVVVPNCAISAAEEMQFCSAQMVRADGKSIGVRKGVMASLGVESQDQWKPITIAPKTAEAFRFSFSTGLLDVRPDEFVRVKFQIWPDVKSTQNWKLATTELSPVFKFPPKRN